MSKFDKILMLRVENKRRIVLDSVDWRLLCVRACLKCERVKEEAVGLCWPAAALLATRQGAKINSLEAEDYCRALFCYQRSLLSTAIPIRSR